MKINVFDTETTGLPLFREPSEDPRQPHLVEIASLLHDEDGTLLESFTALIKPDGWVISPEVSAIHGITHERAMDEGIAERDALDGYLRLARLAGLSVAHNHQFDARIIRIAMLRYYGQAEADEHAARASFCTCETAKPIVKCPPTWKMVRAGFKSFKPPSLAEAYKHFFGEDFVGAHRALADAEGCARIYFAMREKVAA